MTSTTINQGISDGAKPSSNDKAASDTDIIVSDADRVLRPPGGGSSDIFGTSSGSGAEVAPSPARARAPPSSNIFGGFDAPPASTEKPRHNHMKSNVFGSGGDPGPAPGSARKSSRTYESRVFGEVDSNQNKSDEEKEKEKSKENGEGGEEEEEGEECDNNNDTKIKQPSAAAAPVKSKGDSLYNPITHALNIGQTEPAAKRLSGGGSAGGKARGEFNRDTTFNIGAQEDHVTNSPSNQDQCASSGAQPRPEGKVFSNVPDPETQRASTRRINADVSNPITGETKSFAIGPNITKELGKM